MMSYDVIDLMDAYQIIKCHNIMPCHLIILCMHILSHAYVRPIRIYISHISETGNIQYPDEFKGHSTY